MPSWGEILQELNDSTPPGNPPDFDGVRRKYLAKLFEKTGRNVVLYTTKWLGENTPPGNSITLEDMQGLMEVFRGLPGPSLDIILHSPGGSADAAESIVRYMRSKYDDVRVFVPLAAMSAATMWSLAADRIVMGKHSQLGPIDPQLVMSYGMVPARALIRQFDRAAEECRTDPARLSAWVPTLQQYPPGLLELCRDAEDLARELVAKWLASYMFKDLEEAAQKADEVANFFADSDLHKSHGRGIDRNLAKEAGLVIDDLEDDQELQDLVLSVHHAAMHTLNMTACVKLIENHLGRAFVQTAQVVQAIQLPGGKPPSSMPATVVARALE